MYLTQEQINTLGRNLRKKHLRLELLDSSLRTIDRIEGLAISGSINADANNNIRRSGSIEIAVPTNPSATTLLDKLKGFSIEVGGKVWLDKLIKIYIGIDDITTQDIVWYKLGVFLINAPTRTFSSEAYTLSFNCVDLMAKLTGDRQGQLAGPTTVIEQGYYDAEGVYQKTEFRDALISTITEMGDIKKYRIASIPSPYKYLPYDIKLGVGSTVYDILKQLLDILSTWQMYFDLDGVFVVEPIPSGDDAIVYELNADQYISDVANTDFTNVKNQIVVYGRCNTLTYYSENDETTTNNVEYVGNSLILRYSSINTDGLTIGGTTFGFMSLDKPNTTAINNVKIYSDNELLLDSDLVKFENSTNSFGVDYTTAQIEIGSILPNDIYFVRIFSGIQTKDENEVETLDITQPIVFEFMGKQAVAYSMVNENKESPFYINGNLDEPNFYAGLATTPNGLNIGEGFALTLNNDEAITSLQNGAIITFQANWNNLYAGGKDYTSVSVDTKDGAQILNDIKLVQDKWEYDSSGNPYRPNVLQDKISNDYTIWQLRYELFNGTQQFVLVGRNPSAIVKVCSGGEYDNIYADQLAYERCLYELFNHSNLNDSINLDVVPNYLLDVNCKIRYNPNNALPRNIRKDVQAEEQYYITKRITYPLGVDNTPQNINATRIYDSGNLVGV